MRDEVVNDEIRRQFQDVLKSSTNLAIIERVAPIAREHCVAGATGGGVPVAPIGLPKYVHPDWEDAGEAVRRGWRASVRHTFLEVGFFYMLAALENLENDSWQIPPFAWAMVQDAIARARGVQPTVEQLEKEAERLRDVWIRTDNDDDRRRSTTARARVQIAKDPDGEEVIP